MKNFLLTSLLMLSTVTHAQEVLVTTSFTVTIVGCAEGVVSCDDVKYVGVSKKTGNTLRLKGKTLHTMAADGVTPSRFIGWQFRNGKTVYTVTDEGTLEVKQGTKTLVSEQGRWEGR